MHEFLNGKYELMYNAKAKYYPNGTIKITCFSRRVFNPLGSEVVGISEESEEQEVREYEMLGVRADSIKRAKDKIFDIAMMNDFDYMITLTLDKTKIDRYDECEINKKFKIWLNNMQKRKELKYLIIPEYHKDGAVHFHGLVSGNLALIDSDKKDKSGRTIFNFIDWKYGFSTAVKLDGNVLAVSKYITKYITKDFRKIMGKFYYAGGKGLIRDLPTDYCNVDFDSVDGIAYDIPQAKMKVKYITVGEL